MPNITQRQKRLLSVYNTLNTTQQNTVLQFAQFLAQQESLTDDAPESPQAIQTISRPETESVVQAMKRLAASYPMLQSTAMLDKATGLMSQHLLGGRAPDEIIDELEDVFKHEYASYRDQF